MTTNNVTAAQLARLIEQAHPSTAFRMRDLKAFRFDDYAGNPRLCVAFELDGRNEKIALEVSPSPLNRAADAIAGAVQHTIRRRETLLAALAVA